MEKIYEQIRNTGIVPVIKLDSPEKAVPLAQALIDGGICAAEVTFRTNAAAESIKAIHKAFPQMLLGAGTVINTKLAEQALEAGAQFIVSPGFNPNVVDFCIARNVPVIPGVSSPSEIEAALEKGLSVLKFFPAEAAGGVKMLDALAGPFPQVMFMATGGVNVANLGEYLKRKNILAVGGSWMIKDDPEQVTKLTREAVSQMHGFTLGHMGINAKDDADAAAIAKQLALFGMIGKEGNSSWFCNSAVNETSFELMKGCGKGVHGHIALKTYNVERALAYLKQFDIEPDMSTAKYLGEPGKSPMFFVYTTMMIGGFAIHLNKI